MFPLLMVCALLVGNGYSHTFQGCFQISDAWTTFRPEVQGDQNNPRCIDHCRQQAFPLSATRTQVCICMNRLPSQVLALASEGDAASGPTSRCNLMCPGDVGTQCFRDSCCGGPGDAYSVYGTGSNDYVQKLLQNLIARKERLLELAGTSYPTYPTFHVNMPHNVVKRCIIVLEQTTTIGNCFEQTGNDEESNAPFLEFRVDSVEQEVSQSNPTTSQPLGTFDVELDNTDGDTEATMTRTRQVTQTTSQTYTTESGSENSVTVGATVSAGFDAFGAEFSVELSAEYSHSSFYNSGYESANQDTITDTFQITVKVPAGTRKVARFSKRFADRTLKWRSTIYVLGNLQLDIQGAPNREISLSEVLAPEKRTFYGFGTIRGEANPTIIVTIESYDANGNLIDVRPATSSEAQVVATTRKRDKAKHDYVTKSNKHKKHVNHHKTKNH